MKLWASLAAVVIAVFGISVWMVQGNAPEGGTAESTAASGERPEFPPEGAPQPKVELVEGDRFDFGWMEPATTGKHSFGIRNAGQGDLELTAGQTTCKCTFNGLDRTTVKPGETTHITIEWHPENPDMRFRQVAPVFTNDRTAPEVQLVVSGKVANLISSDRESMPIANVTTTQTGESAMLIYSSVLNHFKIVEHEMLLKESADLFEVEIKQAKAGDLESFNALSGYEVRVRTKPGLPLGRFQQKIRFRTDVSSAPPTVLAISGSVSGPISIAGADGAWDEETGVLTLGSVDSAQGLKRELTLFIRGEHQDVSVEKIEVDPADVLKVTAGKLTHTRSGKASMLPLYLEIPKGSRSVNCLGTLQGRLGRIEITTNHPESPTLRMVVRFAVQGL